MSFHDYLGWLKKEQKKQKLLEERETEQAETFTDLRRGEYQDRTGFAGLVNVGDAVRRSDATVGAQVSELDADDPERLAYEAALTSEREDRTKMTRVISGEQYRAEDAMTALEERLEDMNAANQTSGGWAWDQVSGELTLSELETLRSDYDEFIGEFDWYDDDMIVDIEAAMEDARRKKKKADAPKEVPYDPGGGDGDSGSGGGAESDAGGQL